MPEYAQVVVEAPGTTNTSKRRDSPVVGLLVSVGCVALCTALIYPLRQITPAVSDGVVYMLGVLIVSTYYGLWLGLFTSVASTAAFNFFHLPHRHV